jgi:hypothetical protein
MATDEVCRAAARVQGLGEQVRRLAERTAGVEAIEWQSTAADALRRRLAEEAAGVRSVANCLDQAAEYLRRHALAVHEVCSSAR